MTLSDNPLIAEIRKIIHRQGPIPFDVFMDLALYHPQWGYYTAMRERWGRRGDYATGPGISPVLGRLLAKQFHQMWETLGRPGRFSVVEAGAGGGMLSLSLLVKAREAWPDFFEVLALTAVERGGESFDRAAFFREGLHEKITLRESLEGLEPIPDGVVFSNELIDAFPVHWMTVAKRALREIHVAWEGDRFVPMNGPPSTPELRDHLRDRAFQPREGERFTVNLEAGRWIRRVGGLLNRGFVVTIDYGEMAPDLFAPGRSDTLLCYYRRTVHGDPFLHVGEQDITAHVDFSALVREGEKSGLAMAGLATQFQFLAGLGVDAEFRTDAGGGVSSPETILWNQGIKELIHPAGMGGTHKVLIQCKGLEPIPQLDGFSFGRIRSLRSC